MIKLRFSIFALLAIAMVAFTGCDDDDEDSAPTFDRPTVTAPSNVIVVNAGESGSADFAVTFDSDLTATYTATGNNVTISNPSGSASAGTLTINFTGGSEGAGSITVTVTDSQGESAVATAVVDVVDENTIVVSSNITSDVTWTADKTYVLGGRIAVEDGATLTIEAGTVVKGEAGTGANATALLIARGGKLNANGTASAPIIFTSVADEITSEQVATGDFTSPNLDPDQNGLWGGVLVLGRAPISASNDNDEDVSEVQIEGIPTSDPNGLYGGDQADDNSGTITYISIRHGGSNIGEGNEINGLTLGGVGTGTTINWVEVVANQDDGIEWFGGGVSINGIVVWNAGDDALDTDQAWSGTASNFAIVTPGDRPFELDGPEGSLLGDPHTFRDGGVVASDVDNEIFSGDLINTDDNSRVNLENVFFTGINLDPAQQINRVAANDNGILTFTNVVLDVPADSLANHVNLRGEAFPAGIVAGQDKQGDLTGLDWTWADQVGGLDALK